MRTNLSGALTIFNHAIVWIKKTVFTVFTRYLLSNNKKILFYISCYYKPLVAIEESGGGLWHLQIVRWLLFIGLYFSCVDFHRSSPFTLIFYCVFQKTFSVLPLLYLLIFKCVFQRTIFIFASIQGWQTIVGLSN